MLMRQDNGTFAMRRFHRHALHTYKDYLAVNFNATKQGGQVEYFINNSLLRPNDIFDDYDTPDFARFLSLVYIGFSEMTKTWNPR